MVVNDVTFEGEVLSVFDLAGRGSVFLIRLSEGEPKIGDIVESELGQGNVMALADRGIQTRACLTGQEIQPQVGVLVDVTFSKAVSWEGAAVAGRSPEIVNLTVRSQDVTRNAGDADV